MKKIIIILMSFALFNVGVAQKYWTQSGHISFFSSAPMEDISAHNEQVSSILDASSGELVFTLLMTAFNFEKSLMQEHFNEKYVESEKFPKSIFKGSITNIDEIDFNSTLEQTVNITGNLTIHGVTNEITTTGTLKLNENEVYDFQSVFEVLVADYNIAIPAVVKDNIAKNIEITVDMNYKPYGK